MTGFDKIHIAAAFGRTTTIHQLTVNDSFSGDDCGTNFILAFPAPEFIMVSPFALIAPITREIEEAEPL